VTLAYFAATLVREYAMYARHSGIPEVKTILGGFVIQKFLGMWTLVTKAVGLVRSTFLCPKMMPSAS
jgi:chloride channel 3/4/5